MRNPTVSFVIPCYKLAHLLGQCLQSILSQTYGDFEILVMDDCSPDDTANVVNSFQDDRIVHVRNTSNLGHLRNYNKGIKMARGNYIWLISADDYLRSRYVLDRYLGVMTLNPTVGYAFCPGVGSRDGGETAVLEYSVYDHRDRVVNGHELLTRLLERNIVLAASALVRRECYDQVGVFPLDAEWAGAQLDFGWNGDWYLWCMFALYFDVAYFAEPMVCYREHDLAISNVFTNAENVKKCQVADIGLLWLVRQQAMSLCLDRVSEMCLLAIANEYVRLACSKQYRLASCSMSSEEVEESLCRSTQNASVRKFVRSRFAMGMGDRSRFLQDFASARNSYIVSIREDPWLVQAYIKLVLATLGRPGDYIHKALRRFRRIAISALRLDSSSTVNAQQGD